MASASGTSIRGRQVLLQMLSAESAATVVCREPATPTANFYKRYGYVRMERQTTLLGNRLAEWSGAQLWVNGVIIVSPRSLTVGATPTFVVAYWDIPGLEWTCVTG